MPIYEYICAGCDHAFELLLRASERAKCPACGSRKLEKQWSTPPHPETRSCAWRQDRSLAGCYVRGRACGATRTAGIMRGGYECHPLAAVDL